MKAVPARWNALPADEAAGELLACCGSPAWASEVARRRPVDDPERLFELADEIWWSLGKDDWLQAFAQHPRIGESAGPNAGEAFAAWSRQEQAGVAVSEDETKAALAEGNREYERRFGYIYIVCATGKSAQEMLAILRRRLNNDPDAELREAAAQQALITQIRLRKWLESA